MTQFRALRTFLNASPLRVQSRATQPCSFQVNNPISIRSFLNPSPRRMSIEAIPAKYASSPRHGRRGKEISSNTDVTYIRAMQRVTRTGRKTRRTIKVGRWFNEPCGRKGNPYSVTERNCFIVERIVLRHSASRRGNEKCAAGGDREKFSRWLRQTLVISLAQCKAPPGSDSSSDNDYTV